MNTCLDHLLCVLSFRALVNGVLVLLCNGLGYLILAIEANTLVESHWQLILVLHLIVHPFVLEPIIFHQIE